MCMQNHSTYFVLYNDLTGRNVQEIASPFLTHFAQATASHRKVILKADWPKLQLKTNEVLTHEE